MTSRGKSILTVWKLQSSQPTLQGQLVAVHSAYDLMFDNFAPDAVKNNPKARTAWAVETMKKAAIASKRLGLNTHATFSGALLWHTWHPWPQTTQWFSRT